MANQKVVVIDDSRVIRMRVRDMLPEGNFEIIEAKDGLEGLNKIRSENPNLIMLDFLLPKMSGWEVFQEIQKNQQLQTIPLLLMSGRKEEVTEKISEPFEHFAFVEKPFEKEQLIEGIRDAMAKAKKRPTAASPTPAATASDSSAMAAEIEQLNAKIAKMQAEMETLKKQLAQVVTFIRQKLR
ncbi:MAG: response regulator [Prochloraceae cyanobacterium]|nr:response regulator [Prochloraceae cyanobacterium]